ncbi:unnamed protein product [Didymodactylos carnosus]|uniref:LamG domain-containing protein n=1 Tax=Didymodactylos carnosus TaxID=1234261 RepID=A0A815EXT2_9BILA|nr:unnamed protein product [Didymodactylos carnosus]CAF1315956.1 unnamed protein product [Didymodactylos carnosus]CAF3574650.1 unnamed protein product [Didymodactylos carnosus]CAF4157953.1 unnamed protein product [Didymodactylos carnosus]
MAKGHIWQFNIAGSRIVWRIEEEAGGRINVGGWNYITAVYTNKRVHFYVNGSSLRRCPSSLFPSRKTVDVVTAATFQRVVVYPVGDANVFEEFAVFKRALSPVEIKAIYDRRATSATIDLAKVIREFWE